MSLADVVVPRLEPDPTGMVVEALTGIVERNSRMAVHAGARVGHGTVRVGAGRGARERAEAAARRAAVAAYEARWGRVSWDVAVASVAHTTAAVVYELRVEVEW